MHKFYCISLGCSENALDGSLISSYLKSADWKQVKTPQDADLIIVNSCGFTESAEERSIQSYQYLLSIKKPEARVIFAGCLPAINKQAILCAGYNDVLVTPKNLHLLNEITDTRIPTGDEKIGCTPYSTDNIGISFFGTHFNFVQVLLKKFISILSIIPFIELPRWLSQFRHLPTKDTEFIRISVGCRNECSFCSIPRAKGAIKSVMPAIIVERVRDAVRRGKESIALSCDELASYGQDLECNIAILLAQVTALPSKFGLILRNVHPEWMIKYIEELKPSLRIGKIKIIEIPLQSGSDKILRLMKRNHTVQQYQWLLEEIKAVAPRVIIRTQLLVGFPGETDEDFQKTYNQIKKLPIDSFCVHCYSERNFTPAVDLPNKIPADVALERASTLRALDPVERMLRLFRWYWHILKWQQKMRQVYKQCTGLFWGLHRKKSESPRPQGEASLKK